MTEALLVLFSSFAFLYYFSLFSCCRLQIQTKQTTHIILRPPTKFTMTTEIRVLNLSGDDQIAIIDNEDYVKVAGIHFFMSGREGKEYAITRIGGKIKSLHQIVLGAPPKAGMQIDHINRVPLYCRKNNLCS